MPKLLHILVVLLAAWLAGCAQLPGRDQVPVQHALPPPDSPLARHLEGLVTSQAGRTGFRLLSGGLDAFVARMVMIENAQSSLDLQYYLFHNDMIGKLVAAQLLDAADRGVHVRLLLDDWGMAGRDDGLLAMASHPNIDIRLFNPFASRSRRAGEMISDFGRINRRMHNKSLTADGLMTVVGGRNIGDEYFDADPEVAFGDMDVVMIGPAVAAVQHSFDAFWNSAVSYPVELISHRKPGAGALQRYRKALGDFVRSTHDNPYMDRLASSGLSNELRSHGTQWQWGIASIVADDPRKVTMSEEDRSTHLLPQLAPLVRDTQQELLVFSPYFIPGDKGVALFRELEARGVHVSVITNSLASTDVGIVHAGYAKYRKPLLEAGIGLYEMRAQGKSRLHAMSGASHASLHAKTFLFDREKIFIGSLNLDPRSARINTEIGVIIEHADTANAMASRALAGLAAGAYRLGLEEGALVWEAEGRRLTQEPDTHWLRRFSLWLLTPLLVESQL